MRQCWILSRLFLHLLRWLCSSFPFILFMCCVCVTFIDLHILTHLCIPWMKPTWSWGMSFLMSCWIQFVRILLRSLHLCSITEIGL
jgi:hypothetical protein